MAMDNRYGTCQELLKENIGVSLNQTAQSVGSMNLAYETSCPEKS